MSDHTLQTPSPLEFLKNNRRLFSNRDILPLDIFLDKNGEDNRSGEKIKEWLRKEKIISRRNGLHLRAERRVNVLAELVLCTNHSDDYERGGVFSFTDEAEAILRVLDQRPGERTPRSVLDVGTGCGTIALSLAQKWPAADILGIDTNEEAITLANFNLDLNATHIKDAKRVGFCYSDLFAELNGRKYDLIVGDLPIRLKPSAGRMMEGIGYETLSLIGAAAEHLKPSGRLLVVAYAVTEGEKLPEKFFADLSDRFYGGKTPAHTVASGYAGESVCRFGEEKAINLNPMPLRYQIIQAIQKYSEEARKHPHAAESKKTVYEELHKWVRWLEEADSRKLKWLHYIWLEFTA
jgi:methylase of polypeptide subunit release factors